MDNYITGNTIKKLRENKKLTQNDLAGVLNVSDKTVSKWETGRGLPDISMVKELAKALDVSVMELMSGEQITNSNMTSNLIKSRFYVCPICGNIITSIGDAVLCCCGITLSPLAAVTVNLRKDLSNLTELELSHLIEISSVEDQLYIESKHEMTKNHYISFIATVSDNAINIYKQYPEWNATCRVDPRNARLIYIYCNRDGLYKFIR